MPIRVRFGTRNDTLEDLAAAQAPDYILIRMDQTHSDHIHWATDIATTLIPDTDALITQCPNTILSVKTADCLPILIAHPTTHTLAAIHAGRKGTERHILRKTLMAMTHRLGTKEGYQVWFGPCICAAHYEIDAKTHTHYDLFSQNLAQLHAVLSLSDTAFYAARACTVCNNDLYFSYRKEGAAAGRFYSLISIA